MSSQDFVCRIPLKPTNEPPKEEEVRRLLMNPKFRLVDEFAVRYLESIGASPTAANIRMVKSEIPVKRFKLKAAYKSRGGLEDMIYMEKVEPKSEGRHLWRGCAARSLFSEMVDKKLAANTPAAHDTGKDRASALGLLGGAGKTERDTARGSGLASGVLPKLGTGNLPAPNRPPPMSPERRDDIASRVALARLATQSSQDRIQSRTARSRKGRRFQSGHPEHVEDLDSDLPELGIRVTMDDVLSIQTMFTRTFPLAHVRDRLPAEDLAVLVGEMTGVCMAQLVLNLCQLCEWAIVHKFRPPAGHQLADPRHEPAGIRLHAPHTEAPVTDVSQRGSAGNGAGGSILESELSPAVEQVLMDTFKGWVDMQGRVTKRAHMVVAYPIYLMLVRVAVETILRNAVPALFKGPKDEVLVLEKTERIVSAMLDPDGYLNYPLPAPPGKAFVEGLLPARAPPEGVPAINPGSRPWAPLSGSQAAKVHPSSRFYTVSPHVKTLLAGSNCPQLSIFRHAQKLGTTGTTAPASQAGGGKGGKTPRDVHTDDEVPAHRPLAIAAGARGSEGGEGVDGEEEDFGVVLSKVLSRDVLREMYRLALHKRDRLRANSRKAHKGVGGGAAEDESLSAILPMGVEYLKRATMGTSAVAAGGAVS